MNVRWLILAVVLEILSCAGYILAFLQVFDRAPIRLGARIALSELAFGAAVSLGGAGSVAIGALLLVQRGGRPGRVAELSAVLFLLTSAINVITLALAGLGLWTGILGGPSNPLLSLVPGAVGTVVFVAFLVLSLVGLGITEIVILTAHNWLGLDPYLAKIGAVGLAFTWNFLSRKYLLFRARSQGSEVSNQLAAGRNCAVASHQ